MSESESNLIETGCGSSDLDDARGAGIEAARGALQAVERHPVSVVLVFASVRFDPEALLGGIRSVTGTAPLVGASSAGEICRGPLRNSVVVAAIASPYLRVHTAVGRRVSADWRSAAAEAMDAPEVHPFFAPAGPESDAFRRDRKSVV